MLSFFFLLAGSFSSLSTEGGQVYPGMKDSLYIEWGAVAQSVERSTPGEEVPGSIPAVAARSLLFGSVSV